MESSLYNLNIERAVLSLIIFDPANFEEIASALKSEDFYLPFHQHLFRAMESLSRAEKPIDEEFLREELSKSGKFDEEAMLDVLGANPITNTEAYISHIKALSSKRSLLTLATEIKKLTIEEDLEATEVMDRVEKKLYEITQSSVLDDFRASKDITLSMLDEIKRLKALGNSGLIGIDTGFRNLNRQTSGFGKGDLIIIAARPAMGKTALVLNMTLKALERNEGVAFFSLEMPAEQLMMRMLSIKTSIPLQLLRVGNLDDQQWGRFSFAMDEIGSKKLFVDDGGYATIHHVRSKLRKLKSHHPEITMAVIDYLQLMSGDRSREGRQQEISEISRGLKQLARELEIPILALSQLNRGLESRENKRPMLSDLRESGCLAGDTLIVDATTGKEYTIEEIVESRDKILPLKTKSMDNNLKIMDFDIINAFYSGEKLTYKLITKSGKEIKATANHKFYRVDGWVRLDKLKMGDKIATPELINIEKSSSPLLDYELILIAHLLGDGCILKNQPYHYTSNDMKNINIVKESAKELFDIEGRVVQHKNWWHIYLPSPYHLTKNKKNPISLWFKKLNIKRVRSYQKEIPEIIFSCNNRAIKLFLHHLWATDGSITATKGNKNIKVYYSTSSKKLAKQVQRLLLRLGIISTLRSVKQQKGSKNYRENYHILIQGKSNLLNFLENIGSFGKRGENVANFIKILQKIKSNPNNGCIDKLIWKTLIKEAKDKQNISWRLFSKKMGISYCGTTLFKSSISKDRMKKISSFLNNQKIQNPAYSNIYWDEIVSIQEHKVEKTYDLTINSVHNFVANDIIVHNSIEQDADIVMFVYRDDVYREAKEKEKEMKAKAEGKEYKSNFQKKPEEETELIIAKQRNGPTGTVNLIFQKRFTRFVDANRDEDGVEIVYESGNIDTREGSIEFHQIKE